MTSTVQVDSHGEGRPRTKWRHPCEPAPRAGDRSLRSEMLPRPGAPHSTLGSSLHARFRSSYSLAPHLLALAGWAKPPTQGSGDRAPSGEAAQINSHLLHA